MAAFHQCCICRPGNILCKTPGQSRSLTFELQRNTPASPPVLEEDGYHGRLSGRDASWGSLKGCLHCGRRWEQCLLAGPISLLYIDCLSADLLTVMMKMNCTYSTKVETCAQLSIQVDLREDNRVAQEGHRPARA